jgi:hypothetical protein
LHHALPSPKCPASTDIDRIRPTSFALAEEAPRPHKACPSEQGGGSPGPYAIPKVPCHTLPETHLVGGGRTSGSDRADEGQGERTEEERSPRRRGWSLKQRKASGSAEVTDEPECDWGNSIC